MSRSTGVLRSRLAAGTYTARVRAPRMRNCFLFGGVLRREERDLFLFLTNLFAVDIAFLGSVELHLHGLLPPAQFVEESRSRLWISCGLLLGLLLLQRQHCQAQRSFSEQEPVPGAREHDQDGKQRNDQELSVPPRMIPHFKKSWSIILTVPGTEFHTIQSRWLDLVAGNQRLYFGKMKPFHYPARWWEAPPRTPMHHQGAIHDIQSVLAWPGHY